MGTDFPADSSGESERTSAASQRAGCLSRHRGLGGIGLEISNYLARSLRAKMILLGRSSFPAREDWQQWLDSHDTADATSRKIGRIRSLEEQDAEVLVVQADVANLEQMEAALALARDRFGEVHGVFHLAGTPPTTLIQRKTKEMAAGVFAPKLTGTRAPKTVRESEPRFSIALLFAAFSHGRARHG